MKVLITGAAGFIGSHLSEELLKQGHEVVGIDNFDSFYSREIKERNLLVAKENSNFHFIEMDITNADAFGQLNNEQFSVIYHLAANAGVRPSIEKPEKYVDTNIHGTLNILNYMRQCGTTKLVFASSSSIYGNNCEIPFVETANTDEPISPYAFSKKSCELLNYCYHQLYKLDIINLRFFTVYGPRQRPDLAIHKFIKLVSNGNSIEMYGDGSTARDYTYIDDIVKGVVSSGDYILNNNDVYEIVNIGNNSPVKLSELISAIKKVVGKDFPVIQKGEQMGDVDITYASVEKAKQLFGYAPDTQLEEGLTKFYDWYKSEYNS